MKIRYTKPDGTPVEIELTDKALTMGRSPDADIVILDEKASRMHCGIRLWDGEYYVKDLQSRNGTYLNTEKVEMSKLNPGDKVRIGNTIVYVDDPTGPGPKTIMHNVEEDMVGEGKGYDTILKEIVDDVEQQATANKEAAAAASGAITVKSAKGKKPVKIGKKRATTVAMPRKQAEESEAEPPQDEAAPPQDEEVPEIQFDEEVEEAEESATPKVKAKGKKANIKRKAGGTAKVKSRRPTQIKIKRPEK